MIGEGEKDEAPMLFTDGALLHGVRFERDAVVTQSLSMRSRSGAVRVIETRHDRSRSDLITH